MSSLVSAIVGCAGSARVSSAEQKDASESLSVSDSVLTGPKVAVYFALLVLELFGRGCWHRWTAGLTLFVLSMF